jgi:tripartite-type tricarboxylate transporter receptor subunit TctC
MNIGRRQFPQFVGVAAAAVVLVALCAHVARSQTTRTIKIVVPVAPGGATDILARLLAQQIGRAKGPTIVIENRPGAGSVIGTEAVARATPDGGTLLINSNSILIAPHLRKLSYEPLSSFEPICLLVRLPFVVIVNTASPYATLADLIGAAHAKPGQLTLAGAGPATIPHIAVEMLKRAAKVNMVFVPYPGAAPAVNALLGQHVTAALVDYAGVAEHLKARKLRALATGSRDRIESSPEVPTVAESGYKDYEEDLWYGVLAPAKTPEAMISQLTGWFTAALQAPETNSKLVAQGFHPVGTCGADFAAHMRKQYDDYGRIVREANIKTE